MKVLYVRAEQEEGGPLFSAGESLKELLAEEGIELEAVWLGREDLKACVSCGKCWRAHRCIFFDAVNQAADIADSCDGLVVSSPVYYGEPDVQMVRFLERLFRACPEKFAFKPAAFLPLTRSKSAAKASLTAQEYFSMADMIVLTARNQFVLNGSETDTDTLGSLAAKLSWLLRSMEAAQKEGIRSEAVYTRRLDFLR